MGMTDCIVEGFGEVSIEEDTTLDCMRCQFKGTEFSSISVSGPAILSVIDCLFDKCGGCERDPCINIHGSAKTVSLKIIGNVFKDLNTSPIGGPGVGYSHRIE